MIEVISYKTIDSLHFGSTESAAVALFGRETKRRIGGNKETELHYPDLILRFDAQSNQLRECTLLPSCECTINERATSWNNDFLEWICDEDGDLMEAYGFVVSFKMGIALTGFHDGDDAQKAIHVFRLGDWDMLKHRMRPFQRIE